MIEKFKEPTILFLGDPHFSSKNPWNIEVGQSMIQLVKSFPHQPNASVVVLGDLIDSAVNGGLVIHQVDSFIDELCKRFNWVYVLRGNHDYKKYHNIEQLGYEHLKLKDKVTILDRPGESHTIEGFSVLALPHYLHIPSYPPMNEYYEEVLPEKVKDKTFDVVIGHFAEANPDNKFFHGLDLSKYNSKTKILGDIHTLVGPNYTGSMYACKTSENGRRRMFTYSSKGRQEIQMPTLLEYVELDYTEGHQLKENESTIYVYTVKNCGSSHAAIQKFPFIKHLKATIPEYKMSIDSIDLLNLTGGKMTIDVVLKEYVKSKDKPISRDVLVKLKEILTT